MKLTLNYKSCYGTAELCGINNSLFRITHIQGLGLPEREYITASYAGYDGQETISSTCLPRVITLSGDITSANLRNKLAEAVEIMSAPGYLYIESGDMHRRIYCNQTSIPDAQRILYGKICGFTAQFVCDSPFFEDMQSTSVPLYARTRELSTPFTLPCVFGKTVSETDINLGCRNTVEPLIRIVFPVGLSDATSICITNHTSGKKIEFLYAPESGEEIILDIKNRTAHSSVKGNVLGLLSDDTFLGNFVLSPPKNRISAQVGDINAGILIECIYNNRYNEAMLV